ncbi:MAG: NfeD family protein [Treponemataceae bacterium]|nr:NfeD family protein [Treponemataceae bacterium]
MSHLYWFWLAVCVLCVVVEAATMALTTIWFALSAVVMIFVSLLPIPFVWQLLIFVLIATVLLIFTRPFAIKKLNAGKKPTNSDALIGRSVRLEQEITPLKKGTVTINGIKWNANTADCSPLAADTLCTITAIAGSTVIVEPQK